MKIKRTIPLLALLVLAGAFAAFAPAASSGRASLVIRHQVRGCHAWSLNGGAYGASQTVAIRHGGSVLVTNNDVMPHRLVQTSGASVTYTRVTDGMMGLKGTFPPAMLARMGAASKITFAKVGVYRFTTRPGEDYMPGVRTVGDDNVLRLTVRVG
jgi:hypothetical protein